MDYNKTTWKTGDVISGTKLNKIETAIDDIADELTLMQNLRVYYKSPADFGATAAEDIGTMISMMNGYSTVKFWINSSDSYPLIYNFVYDGITADINAISHAYGIVTIEVTGNCACVIFEPYDATDRYEIRYSSVNSVGWDKWVRYAPMSGFKNFTRASVLNGKDSVSVPANSEVSFDLSYTTPSGFEAITLISLQTGAEGVFYEGCSITSSTSIRVWLYNVTSTAKTANFRCFIIFKRL